MLWAVIPPNRQLFSPKQIQGESVLWLRRLLPFMRLNTLLQSSYDLWNNHKVSVAIEKFKRTSPLFLRSASYSDITKRWNPHFVKITEMSSYCNLSWPNAVKVKTPVSWA